MKTLKSLPTGPKERLALLESVRNRKMARSAHAFVRGNTIQFYEWLRAAKRGTLPEGPAIWICGDCHLGNLGPIANANGRIDIQIRDLDQTVIGNPAHDLIRLGLSLASAARGSDLSGVTTAKMIEEMVEGYELAFEPDWTEEHEDELPDSVQAVLRASRRRSWKDLARDRIQDERPVIPLGKRFWPLEAKERREIVRLFSSGPGRQLATQLRSRDDDARVEVVDAAYWMKGCSSLGLLRYAVLVKIGEKRDNEFCLMDIKEATEAAAPAYADAETPQDHASRIVEGARHLSPNLGRRMLAARLQGKAVFIRELLPQDLKIEVASLTPEEAIKTARFLATVVGRAHTRQLSAEQRRSWQSALQKNRPKTLDAPSWLWSAIVDLLMRHERGYLEHCRRYALPTRNA